MAAIWPPQQTSQPAAGPLGGLAPGSAAAFPPLPTAAAGPPCPLQAASSAPESGPTASFGVCTPPLPTAPPALVPGLCEWLGMAQPAPSSPALSFEPPLPLPQQAPVTPGVRQAAPLVLPLPPAQQAAALHLLQQLLLPVLAALPAQQQVPEAAQPWQQAWQPAAAASSNAETPLQQPPGPSVAEAEAVAAATAVLALAAEASSTGTAPAVPAAAPAPSASPPPLDAPWDDAPLPFQPHGTPSVQAALCAQLPRAQAIRGAREQSGVWQAWIHYNKKQAFVGRLSRQAAAVAADLVLAWQRRCLTAKVAEKAATRQYNIPAAGYEADAELLAQLSLVGSADQMKQFLQAVIPQAPPQPHPPQTAAAPRTRARKRGAGGSAGGSKKRRRATADAEERLPVQPQAAPAVAPPPAAPEQDLQQAQYPAAHPASKAHARKQAAPRRAPTPDSPTAERDAGGTPFERRRSDDESESAADA